MFFLLTPLIRHMVVARDPDRMTSDDLDDNKWVSLTQVCFLTVPLCSLS